MGAPYEIDPQVVTLPAGEDHVWVEIDFPTRVLITKLIAKRISGSSEFTAQLYNSKLPMEHEDEGWSLSDDMPSDVYEVGPRFSSSSGKIEYFSDFATGGHGLTFYNKDAPEASRIQGVGQRKLYLRIGLAAPVGSNQRYGFTVAGEDQVSY